MRELPHHDSRLDEASKWIAKLDKGLSTADTLALQRWMSSDHENQKALYLTAELWDKMDVLSQLADLFAHDPSSQPVAMRPLLAIAASLVLATVIGIWGFSSLWNGESTSFEPHIVDATRGIYETAVGEYSTVELSDGTRIVLNTNSRIQVRYNDQQRLIKLDRGEVNIEVAHEPHRPLSVLVGDRVVQAIGTVFNIKIDSKQKIELVVTEGKVRVGVRPADALTTDTLEADIATIWTGHEMAVAQSEKIILGSPGEQINTLSPEDIEVHLSWKNGHLIFRGESLGDAVAEIGRYTPVEFIFIDDELQKVRVAGLFKTGDIDGFLATLKANFNISYEQIDDDKVLLKSP